MGSHVSSPFTWLRLGTGCSMKSTTNTKKNIWWLM